jgi:hypothetical protein
MRREEGMVGLDWDSGGERVEVKVDKEGMGASERIKGKKGKERNLQTKFMNPPL